MQHGEQGDECSHYKGAWAWGKQLSLHGCRGCLGCGISWAASQELPLTSFLPTHMNISPDKDYGLERRCCSPSTLPAAWGSAAPHSTVTGRNPRNIGGTGGERGYSRGTITELEHFWGSLKSPEIILLWSRSLAGTAPPARAIKGTTMGNRVPITAT